ncbi:MAG: C39 family peptidase [Clostridia bacterium]|nr:C39 family peptidase [Clostridia bacterium]
MQKGRFSLIFMIISIVCLCLAIVLVLFAASLAKNNMALSAQTEETAAAETAAPEKATDTEPIYSNTNEPISDEIPKNKLLRVEPIMQKPELPNGCEIVALATVLRYLGFDIDKSEFARDYLPCGEVGKVAPDVAYVGDPTSDKTGTAFGCLAPVITRCANQFFEDNEADYYAVNLTGTPLSELKEYVTDGIPVIMWTTLKMYKSPIATTWNINGTKYTWLEYSHCSVLSGYTTDRYIFSDPLYGIAGYPADKVEAAYKSQYMQAVAILKKPIS